MYSAIPIDLLLFGLAVIGMVGIGLPMITGRVWVPRRVEFQDVPEHELTPAQTAYFAPLDASLLEIGYRAVSNTVPTNMQGRALVRLYLSGADPAVIMMNLLTSPSPDGQEHPMNYLEIMTRYEDGGALSTRNAEISEVLDQLPDHTIIERRGLREPAALKAVHDAQAEEFKIRRAIFLQAEDFEQAFHEYHERWCIHQIERGLLRPKTGSDDRLRPTTKAGLRGIFNYLNPFADNFTPLRGVLVLVFGLLVPGAVLLWLGGPGSNGVEWMAAFSGLEPGHCLIACCALLFGLAGLVAGTIFVTKAFVWSFLLTYALLRMVGPTGIWITLGLSIWSGVSADWAARIKERGRKLA